MTSRLLLPTLLLSVVIAACGKETAPAPAPPPVPAAVVPDLPPPQEVGDSCAKDCGNGVKAEIQCAAGETPVCDCAATPNASCQLAKAPDGA